MALLLVDTSLLFVCRFRADSCRRPPTTADDRADSTADDRRRPPTTCRFHCRRPPTTVPIPLPTTADDRRRPCRFHCRRPPTTADDRADSTADDRRRPPTTVPIPLPTTADDRADSTADDRRRPCRFKISDQYFARRQAAAESAAETVRPSGSPSPVRPTRPARPGANVATGNILADADAAFTMDLNDEPANADAHADVAGPPVDSRHIEKAAWAMMDKAEMKLGLHKGKFSVLRLYANPAIRSKYPIHCILALVVYGAVHNEADCERTFAFSGSYHLEPKPAMVWFTMGWLLPRHQATVVRSST